MIVRPQRSEDYEAVGPSSRIPVPASSTTVVRSPRSSSRREVLRSYSSVVAPGVASEPREPQIVAIILYGFL